MTSFTTRPEIVGTFGTVASTHWIASQVGMRMLELGGNAFDAAVATGFALQVVEPHLNGPGGDMPAVLYSATLDRVEVVCGQGPAPAGATIDRYRAEGLDSIPGDGLLATVVPGAFGGWMRLLRDHGTLELRTVLGPAIHYARHGHPALARVAATIAEMGSFFEEHWPTSHATWLPNGRAPRAGELLKNPVLADTWTRLLGEAEAADGTASGREARIEAATRAFHEGFVAEAIDAYLRDAEVMDGSGARHRAVLTGDDLARWSATVESPVAHDYHGWRVSKTAAWGQGPVLLQTLALLDGTGIESMDPSGPDFVHTVVEAMKLSFADREAYYGDSGEAPVPLDTLLSPAYNDARRRLIEARASLELRPGRVDGFEDQVARTLAMLETASEATRGVYEPTMAHLAEDKPEGGHGDTVHIDVADRFGNLVAITPSGGWLQSSPTIPGLGFCLNSRAQMFWLEPGLPASLVPGRRPRTTLTPSIAVHEGGAKLAFGTPGGDQQDQWQLPFFLRHVHRGMNLQEAIDAPLFHTTHFPSSFHPRSRAPGNVMVEASLGAAAIAELRRRGHDVTVADEWSVGRLVAARRDADGLLRAGATPRLMQAYAVGR